MKTSDLLVIGALLLVLTGIATQSEAAVNVRVNLPAYRFAAPPEVVVIPGTYVYMVPDIDVDVLFYQGYWWRPYEGQWYRSRNYKGHWRHIGHRHIPRGLRALPQDYRHRLLPGYERIPNGHVQKHWRKWERDRHWDRRGDQGRRGHDGPQDDQDRERQDHRKDRY